MITVDCKDCEKNSKLKEARGCNGKSRISKPVFEEIENGVYYRYLSCPYKFISQSVYNFVKVYRYYKDFPSAPMPDIENVSYRFLAAYQYYESKLTENLEEKAKNGR